MLLREIQAQGWEVAGPRAYPAIVAVDPDRVTRGLTRRELAGMTAILEAIADLVAADRDLASAWQDGEPRQQRSEVETGSGSIAVDLRAPLWLAADGSRGLHEEDARIAVIDEDGCLDEELWERHRAAILDRFTRSAEAEPAHLAWAEILLEYAARYHGSTIAELTPIDLQALLFETIPRKVSVEATAAPEIVGAMRALLAFAARELGSGQAERCLEGLRPDAVRRLARELGDPRNFGPAKSLVMAGARAGYDIGTEAGLAAWLEAVNTCAVGAQPRVKFASPRRRSSANTRIRRKTARKARKRSRKRYGNMGRT